MGGRSAREAGTSTKTSLQSRLPSLTRARHDVGRRTDCERAANPSHATSLTHRRRRLGSRVDSGSNKKKGQRFAGRISARDGVIHGAALYIFVR